LPGRELLVFGDLVWGRAPVPIGLSIPACGGTAAWSAVTPEERAQLAASHPVCAECAAPAATCAIDPCTLTSCDAAGATCRADSSRQPG